MPRQPDVCPGQSRHPAAMAATPVFDPKPTKPVFPTIIDADQQIAPEPKDSRRNGLSARQARLGEKQNARKLFANCFFGFGVRRGDCFVRFGS